MNVSFETFEELTEEEKDLMARVYVEAVTVFVLDDDEELTGVALRAYNKARARLALRGLEPTGGNRDSLGEN